MTFWNDPINFIADWLQDVFIGWGASTSVAEVITSLIGIVVMILFAMVIAIALVWVERKVVARFQDRLGPNRIGPFGIFQPFADIVKLVIKEDIIPAGADRVVFNMAPVISLASVILIWAIIPLASNIYGVDINVGVLYLVAVGSFGTLSVIMAGWASNNKYALIGAFRMVATMISYEIPMVVALMIPTIISGTMSVQGITQAQSSVWFAILSPLGFLLFMISAIAELGRSPFDLNEAESEIVAGFHIEYTGMKFGLFYAGELLHAFTFGGFMAVLFFGGYGGFFGLENVAGFTWLSNPFIELIVFLVKAMIGYWIIMWIKYSMPRIRIDHMLAFNWKFLTPLAFVLLMVTALFDKLLAPTQFYVAGMFLSNVVLGWIVIEILRKFSKHERVLQENPAEPVVIQAANHGQGVS
ncbi:MAG TPA: NADH-quinone oxidoreductase subunit NuoH [Anaerolineales bacterium]|nr:NADH-quinone oxidoreductase subunit NuoH [Anaerolineales bacterium]